MSFLSKTTDSCLVPKLLGCYEADLHPHSVAAKDRAHDAIIKVECAAGYYAVGFARLLPGVEVWAFDTQGAAQTACRRLAEANAVVARLQVGGTFRGEDFEGFRGGRCLVICDIEGGEVALLDPECYPASREFDVIAEFHDLLDPEISPLVTDRFLSSHSIEPVKPSCYNVSLPDMFDHPSDLLRFLPFWEWRGGPTSWAVMSARELPPA